MKQIGDYWFYQEPLTLASEDAERLAEVLGDPATYRTFKGGMRCGGFHPDYAAEWRMGVERYYALVCFGCGEVKVFGPGIASRHTLGREALEALKPLLQRYRKNRPSPRTGFDDPFDPTTDEVATPPQTPERVRRQVGGGFAFSIDCFGFRRVSSAPRRANPLPPEPV